MYVVIIVTLLLFQRIYKRYYSSICRTMVSTRGVRYKFSEGERVLCYEPDPTKAKVLYDSKVLEVIESKDRRGRRTVEYLIHFQGWNSSWDRCVSEDFVLKDTEENRQLQRDLAEKSQLQLGAYLYRRERKKGNSTTSGPGPAKRPRHGFSDDGSSSSTQPDAEDGETGDTDSSSESASSAQPNSPPNTHTGRASIVLPSALRDRLTFDYHLVVKRGRLSRLPASPCVAYILESYVKWFARAGAWNPPRARHDPAHKPDMLDVSCRLNLLREVADGLRVYFDFILQGHLLYRQEAEQYYIFCGQYMDEPDIKSEPNDEDEENLDPALDATMVLVEQDLKSPKLPEYSHLPPDPDHGENGVEPKVENIEPEPEGEDEAETEKAEGAESEETPEQVEAATSPRPDETVKRELRAAPRTPNVARRYTYVEAEPEGEDEAEAEKAEGAESEETPEQVEAASSPKPDESVKREPRAAPRTPNVARRLRSHKSAVSQSENEEPAPSTSTAEQRTFETLSSSVGSSGSSVSESWALRPPPAPPAPAAPARNPLSQLLEKVGKWQLVPREDTEHLPCRVYGAIHLARLFVKLPDFLNATQMPDFKLKLILKHVDMFVQYLEEHNEWFGESYYVTDGASRSH